MESQKGQVVLVNKSNIPLDRIEDGKPIEITPKELKQIKPKREMSEVQQAHIKNLIEFNKQRKLEKDKLKAGIIPDDVPENEIPVIIKKRAYKKDVERREIASRLEKLEQLLSSKMPVEKPVVEKPIKRAVEKPPKVPVKNSLTLREGAKPLKEKKKVVYVSDTDTDTDTTGIDTDYDSDDNQRKTIRRAVKRIETVRKIEQELAKPRLNRYSNLSVF
jgi:hypothetical protein